MRILAIILFSFGCIARASEVGQPPKESELPKLLSPEEASALWAKQKKDDAEAMARLPLFDEERLELIIKTLRDVKYPITFETLRDKLGGPDSLVWCCTQIIEGRQTDTFSVAANALEYVLVVDYDDSAKGQRPSIVGRARLCYRSPFGWRFAAESSDDRYQVGTPEKRPNQPSEPTAASGRGSP